jgi:hypothetical protein
MTRYIKFITSDGSPVLVEVEEDEVAPSEGVQKAGLLDKLRGAKDTVAQAQETLDGALERVVKANADALMESVRNLIESPDTVEATFGLKATGEAGNFAIAKIGGEINFSVKLNWKPISKNEVAQHRTG